MLKTKPNEIANQPQAPHETSAAVRAPRRGLWQEWLHSLLLFCGASVYVELCLHLCVYRSMDRRAVYLVLFGLLGGTVCTLLTTHLPKIARQIVGVLLVAVQVLFAEVQLMYHAIFGNFMPISQVSMGGNVITNFDSQILYSIGKNIAPILLLLVPLIVTILCLALRKLRVLTVRLKWRQALATLGILLTLLLATMGIMYAGRGKSFSVYKTFTNVNTSTDSSYKSVGMLATTVQELRYMVFGSSGSVIITPSSLGTDTRRLYSSNSYNVIERIDFAKLAESADDAMRKTTDEYLAQVVPTRKNNYTGLLQDYNLITICAESFCPWFISEELTPTLYKLSHTGIIFDNYYGTFQSVTTNGEYTMCMGLYPDMSRTKTDSSFNVAGTNYLPFCLGNALKEKGYQTWGYHDYIGDFYNRNITHANMGYTFKAADSGLDIKIDWPSSDLEMMEASVDDYLSSREPFHAYYMTFSGHYQYNWDNAMSAKNHDAVKDLPYSEPVKAYIACNLELENALTYLMQRLEQAGVADKTCIVLTNDHYPYGLTEDEYNELAVLSDKSFLTKSFRYDAGTEAVIPADESIVISDEQLEAYRLYVDNKFQMSSNIVNSDYYAHVFGKASSGGTLEDTVVFTDITGIFNQASVLYMYRNGYIDPATPDTFGGKAAAKVGEFVDVLYRISQRPETDNTALPPDYETEEFNGSACPYYDAVCWAYQAGLLRQGDLHTAYDDDMDYQTACLLIYRYAAMSGIDTRVDQELARQTMRENPRLSGEVVKAMLWCDQTDITTRDSEMGELLAAYDTRINRYQMTSFLFYLCTYELNSRNEA